MAARGSSDDPGRGPLPELVGLPAAGPDALLTTPSPLDAEVPAVLTRTPAASRGHARHTTLGFDPGPPARTTPAYIAGTGRLLAVGKDATGGLSVGFTASVLG